MTAGRYDLQIEQGATFSLPLQYRQSNGTPVDLSGCSARMQIREAPNSPVIVEFNSSLTANGFIILNGPSERREDGANGNLHILLSAANSAALPAFRGRYDLEIEFADQTVVRLLEGQVRVESEITR